MCRAISLAGFMLLLFLVLATAQQAAAEKPLTNDDIIQLSNLALGDDLIIAKIKQAKNVAFHLDTESLITLSKQGVGKDVIAAMLKRSTPSSTGAHTSAPKEAKVTLVTNDGKTKLKSLLGTERIESPFWAGKSKMIFLDFAGVKAGVRTTDKHPKLIVHESENPTGRYYWVRLAIDKKRSRRPIHFGTVFEGKMSQRKSYGKPENKKLIVKFSFEEIQPGFYQFSIDKDLKPGEYGLLTNSGELFEFGVD